MTVSETQIELGAAAIAREGFPRGQESAGDYRQRLSRAALTAALSDQVAISKAEYDSLMKREHAMSQVVTVARDLGEVTKKLGVAEKENRRLVRLNKKLAAPPASTAGEVG